MKKYKCVIFDCDGILVDSEFLANNLLVEMSNELGAKIDIEYALKKFKGDSLTNCINHVKNLLTTPLPSNFELEYRRRSFELFTKNLKPINGILEIIKSLNIPFCVASSGPPSKIIHNLKLTGLLPYFEGRIFSCYDIKKWKPEPDIFLHAAKSMGFSVDECVVIEDTLIGISAASSGGFDVFGFADAFSFETFSKKATKTFTSMTELKKLLAIIPKY